MTQLCRILFVLVLIAAAPLRAAEVKLESEDDKTLYALGLIIAQSLASYGLNEPELATVQAGMTDGILGREPKVKAEEFRFQISSFQKKRNAVMAVEESKAGAEFAAAAAKKKGAVTTDSGLVYIEITPGTGKSPAATDTVKVHYHGTLRDGTVFDSSVDRGTPATFPLDRVVKCWTEGVQRMKVGGKSQLVCPAEIAYGERGAPPKIKPGATLSFEVELLEVVEQAPKAKPAPKKE